MALADTITSLGTSIINLVGTRAKTDLSNITSAGQSVISGLASGVPVGTVIAYMGSTAPTGFLLMDGREVSKTTYADLYAVVGDTMGTATDNTKFVIADMTDGRYLMGSTVAGSSGSEVGSTVSASLPNVKGTINSAYTFAGATLSGCFISSSTGTSYYSQARSSTSTTKLTLNASSLNSAYSDSATTVTPESLAVGFYIRY